MSDRASRRKETLGAKPSTWNQVQSVWVYAPPGGAATQVMWTWLRVGDFAPGFTLYLDAASLIMVLVVTFVAFLIHLYSAEHMLHDEGYSRFFAYMNLFVGMMLMLVLADNLLLLYLGWEGVGLCSYLLIGFWYKDPANGRAARKAFVVTRVGDASMAVGLFILFTSFGTLAIQPLMQHAAQAWPVGSALPVAVAALLLGGAVGKSAQLPLQTWLPDAMAGPTPVSALIHAATMVTAGVYLIARTHVLFALAPAVQLAVAIVGVLTLLLAGFSALTQWDIKRVLAYSTISQIGYMFLALGVGAWSAALFHFMTHAFFKALLFLGAGVVIVAMHEDHNMFHMGGLRRRLPLTFWTFLIASLSLSALPIVTAGFYSKDMILTDAFTSRAGSVWLWLAGLVGALLTSLYTFRMVFVTFFGPPRAREAAGHPELVEGPEPVEGAEGQREPVEAPASAHPELRPEQRPGLVGGPAQGREAHYRPGVPVTIPLLVLAVLSVVGGFVQWPVPLFTDFLHTALPPVATAASGVGEVTLQVIAGVISVLGIALAYVFFVLRPQIAHEASHAPAGAALHRFWFLGWGFDWLYHTFVVRPYAWLARVDRDDVVDLIYRGLAWLGGLFNRALSDTESGRVRWYAMGVAAGAVIVVAVVLIWH